MSYRYSIYIQKYNESVKLDLNEFNFEHPIEMKNQIFNAMNMQKTITHYSNMYNINTINLINKIAKYNKINNDNILLSAGSDVGLEYLVSYLIKSTTTVYIFVPTYSYFNFLSSNITKNIIYIPFCIDDYDYDIDLYISKYIKNDNLDVVIYIVNPNNPTGILFDGNKIENILIKYSNFKFIIDEAYIEYCFDKSCVEYINKYSNLFITRTFSKAYGLAGLRIGYILSDNKNILALHKYFNESSLSEISKVAANFIHDNINIYEDLIDTVIRIRKNFEFFLDCNKIVYIKSQASFISFYIGDNCDMFIDILKSHNIYIRSKDKDTNMKGYIRISIGTENIMDNIKKIILDNILLISQKNE